MLLFNFPFSDTLWTLVLDCFIIPWQVGHRCLTSLVPPLQGMSWKTSPAKHVSAFLAFEHVLAALLMVCTNGLVPDKSLQEVPGPVNFLCFHARVDHFLLHTSQAWKASHAEAPFEVGKESFDAVSNYIMTKIRQMATKVRNLIKEGWETLNKKLTERQQACFLRLCRILAANFCSETSEPKQQSAGSTSTKPRETAPPVLHAPPVLPVASAPTLGQGSLALGQEAVQKPNIDDGGVSLAPHMPFKSVLCVRSMFSNSQCSLSGLYMCRLTTPHSFCTPLASWT